MHNITILLLFIVIYIFIAIQRFPFIKIDRPAGVFTGVTLLLLSGLITLPESYGFIDWNVIVFLLGMMIMVAYLQLSGFFAYATSCIIRLCKTPKQLLAAVIASSALLSALFVNDTVCLLFTPIVLSSCRALGISPLPYLIALAISANLGSAMTVTGNPQNMYIGITSGIPFMEFLKITFFPALVSLVFTFFVINFVYGKKMATFSSGNIVSVPDIDKPLMIKSLLALGLTIVLFIFGVNYPFAALIGASLIIVWGRIKPKAAVEKVDWPILLFFAGLFVIMGAFGKAGYTEAIMGLVGGQLDMGNFQAVSGFSAVLIALSNLVSNLPAVILLSPMADTKNASILLALISTFAGNLTLVGSVANLIVAEIASREGENMGFFEYMKTGVIITLFSCVIAVLWIYFII